MARGQHRGRGGAAGGRRDDPAALPVGKRVLHAGPDGVDEVELRLRAHPGAPPLPVHKGASGGELSRVMLAIEVVLSHADPVPTLVFDEVDAGVGGRAAVEIGAAAGSAGPQPPGHRGDAPAAGGGVRGPAPGGGQGLQGQLDAQRRAFARRRGPGHRAGADAGRDGSTHTGRAHAEELLGAAAADKAAYLASTTKKRRSKKA